MLRKMDEESTVSWFQRTLAKGANASSGEHADAGAVVKAQVGKNRDGWDPWDVWLRYVEQPRRARRNDGPLK